MWEFIGGTALAIVMIVGTLIAYDLGQVSTVEYNATRAIHVDPGAN